MNDIISPRAASSPDAFTPALGHKVLTPLYDAAIALLTRERRWRTALVAQIAPRAGDVIADIGCGTGTLALMLKRAAPAAKVIGLDPDADVLALGREKARREGLAIDFQQGFANAAGLLAEHGVNKVVSSLVFHQTPLAEKRAGLHAMRAALQRGGEIHIADYGLQRTALMRLAFGVVQNLDGRENTQPNAEGVLLKLLVEAGFADAAETRVIATPTGSISFYRGAAEARS